MTESPTVFAAGCIVVNTSSATPQFLLIHDRHGAWSFPKGHCDPGETSQQTAVREVFEETGIRGQLGALVDSIVYPVVKKGQTRLKQVDFYLLYTTQHEVHIQHDEGITDFRWLCAPEVSTYLTHEAVTHVFETALTIIDTAAPTPPTD